MSHSRPRLCRVEGAPARAPVPHDSCPDLTATKDFTNHILKTKRRFFCGARLSNSSLIGYWLLVLVHGTPAGTGSHGDRTLQLERQNRFRLEDDLLTLRRPGNASA